MSSTHTCNCFWPHMVPRVNGSPNGYTRPTGWVSDWVSDWVSERVSEWVLELEWYIVKENISDYCLHIASLIHTAVHARTHSHTHAHTTHLQLLPRHCGRSGRAPAYTPRPWGHLSTRRYWSRSRVVWWGLSTLGRCRWFACPLRYWPRWCSRYAGKIPMAW